jgi:hypothetical protein|tara:strand:- start:33 stop:230 length:198 start_codon:yes stop_codon:yes gene_type:complete
MSELKFTPPTTDFEALILAMKLCTLADSKENFERAATQLLYWSDKVHIEDVSLAKERCMQELGMV